MDDVFWPGSHRAGDITSGTNLIQKMVQVEQAWLEVLVESGVAAGEPVLAESPSPDDLVQRSEAGGNPVIPLVHALRASSPEPAATWLHRGLTSQDVLDSAMMLLWRDVIETLLSRLDDLVHVIAGLAREHRSTPMIGRTLTQHAVPLTFGLKAATWLDGLLDAQEDLRRLEFPVQLGGAAGTMAAAAEISARADVDPDLRSSLSARLGLSPRGPWHTNRAPVTRIGDVLVRLTDSLGRMSGDVTVLSRNEIGELSEGAPGESSTMPHKHNPVLSTLITAQATRAPMLAAALHSAAAGQYDERPAGAWHAEWPVIRDLADLALVAVSQAVDLTRGLNVHTERMAANLAAAWDAVHAERDSLPGSPTDAPYLGHADQLVDAVLDRIGHAP